MDHHQDTPPAVTPPAPPPPPPPPPPLPPSAPPSPLTKLSPRMILFAVIGVVAAALILMLCFGQGGDDPMGASIPTHRQITTDVKEILSDHGLPNKILSLQIDDKTLSERFKTYTVDCTATVSAEDGTVAFSLTLYYKYADAQWTLSSASIPK